MGSVLAWLRFGHRIDDVGSYFMFVLKIPYMVVIGTLPNSVSTSK